MGACMVSAPCWNQRAHTAAMMTHCESNLPLTLQAWSGPTANRPSHCQQESPHNVPRHQVNVCQPAACIHPPLHLLLRNAEIKHSLPGRVAGHTRCPCAPAAPAGVLLFLGPPPGGAAALSGSSIERGLKRLPLAPPSWSGSALPPWPVVTGRL